MTDTNRIKTITLDETSLKGRSMEAEHEKTVAITDLLHDNRFTPHCMKGGPYDVHLSVGAGKLVFDITSESGEKARAELAIAPLRGSVRDYFIICESYYEALKKHATPVKIEAIDMARRGVHNEGSEELQTLLKGRITVDFQTARRLFTLICVLHIK